MNHPTQVFWTLIQRELWEHRGAFLWTPLAIAATLLLLLLMGAGSSFFWQFKIEGASHMTAGALKLAEAKATPEQLRLGVMGLLWGSAILWQSVLFIVLFFYCIACLYDDRRDRSVLFWKSMPVSDLETVASKVAMALLVAPALAFAAMVIGQLLLIFGAGLLVAMHGGSPWKLVWAHANPLGVWGQVLALIGVQALYMLPFYAWLMLAGSFARGKPFLWATLPPVVLAIVESWLRFTADFSVSRIVWEFILRRLASGVAPVSFNAKVGGQELSAGLSGTRFETSFTEAIGRLTTADLWIGVAIGLLFLAAAVWLRRYRDDATS